MDRTGVVLVGAIAIVATDHLTSQQAWDSVDIPTIGMLLTNDIVVFAMTPVLVAGCAERGLKPGTVPAG